MPDDILYMPQPNTGTLSSIVTESLSNAAEYADTVQIRLPGSMAFHSSLCYKHNLKENLIMTLVEVKSLHVPSEVLQISPARATQPWRPLLDLWTILFDQFQ